MFHPAKRVYRVDRKEFRENCILGRKAKYINKTVDRIDFRKYTTVSSKNQMQDRSSSFASSLLAPLPISAFGIAVRTLPKRSGIP